MVCRSLLIYLTVEVVALVMTWLLTEGTAAQGKMDGLTGYRLGSAARRKQHRRVEGGVQEAAVRRAADALDVELLQQCQLRAGWASVNWIHSAAHSADISSFSPLGKMALRKKCIRPC